MNGIISGGSLGGATRGHVTRHRPFAAQEAHIISFPYFGGHRLSKP